MGKTVKPSWDDPLREFWQAWSCLSLSRIVAARWGCDGSCCWGRLGEEPCARRFVDVMGSQLVLSVTSVPAALLPCAPTAQAACLAPPAALALRDGGPSPREISCRSLLPFTVAIQCVPWYYVKLSRNGVALGCTCAQTLDLESNAPQFLLRPATQIVRHHPQPTILLSALRTLSYGLWSAGSCAHHPPPTAHCSLLTYCSLLHCSLLTAGSGTELDPLFEDPMSEPRLGWPTDLSGLSWPR